MVLKCDDYDELRILKLICFREYYLNLSLFSLTKNENSRKDIYFLFKLSFDNYENVLEFLVDRIMKIFKVQKIKMLSIYS